MGEFPSAEPRTLNRGGRVLGRGPAFGLATGLFFLLLFASSAPSPLYGVYRLRWHFSVIMLTVVFAVYAVTLLAALLCCGSLSDYLGRRSVIAAALITGALACGAFLIADGVGWLLAARALQGLAVGLATSALGGALIDLQPDGSALGATATSAAPSSGLALGALAASALVQYGPAPTHLVWWILLAACLAGVGSLKIIPETVAPEPGALRSLRPHIAVSRQARVAFLASLPCLIAVWALGGFYLSLGPALAVQLLHSSNLMWGGLAIFLLNGSATGAAIAAGRLQPPSAMLLGCLLLVVGVAGTLVAIATTSAVAFLIGVSVAGLGFGSAFLGALRSLSALADPHERAGLVSAVYIVAYVAVSVPVVIAGVATSQYGLHDTALVFSAALVVLAAMAAGGSLLHRPTHTPR